MAEVRGSTGSPTVRRRELGATLRTLRLDRGFTVDQVAEHLECSPSKVSRMETGRRGATPRDIRDLCDLYDVSGAEPDIQVVDVDLLGDRQLILKHNVRNGVRLAEASRDQTLRHVRKLWGYEVRLEEG